MLNFNDFGSSQPNPPPAKTTDYNRKLRIAWGEL